jgi:hypothetical protein
MFVGRAMLTSDLDPDPILVFALILAFIHDHDDPQVW